MKGNRLIWGTLILTALVTVWRCLLLPTAADKVTLSSACVPLLLVMVIAAALLLLCDCSKGKYTSPAAVDSPLTDAAGLFAGLGMAAVSLFDGVRWLIAGVQPAPGAAKNPAAQIPLPVAQIALLIALLAGITGGVFMMAFFIRRHAAPNAPITAPMAAVIGETGALAGVVLMLAAVRCWRVQSAAVGGRALPILVVGLVAGLALAAAFLRWQFGGRWSTGWLWLLPALWMFARLVRYDVLYAMTVNVASAVYEFVVFGTALLFLVGFARYMAGAGKPYRRLRGLSAAAAVLLLSATLSRAVFFLAGDAVTLAYCPLPGVADGLLGLFALAAAGFLKTPDEVPAAVEAAADTPDEQNEQSDEQSEQNI